MGQEPVAQLSYYGISPWEIEVVYGIFNGRFHVKQTELEIFDADFVSVLNIDIPVAFNDEFFKWFEFRRWDKVKAILKEMKRRRGQKNALKIDLCFSSIPKIRFVADSDDRSWFDNSLEKIDFVLELLPYHLDPTKLPDDVTEIVYKFDANAARWRLSSAFVNNKKFVFSGSSWKLVI
jgi:hypothetical protein